MRPRSRSRCSHSAGDLVIQQSGVVRKCGLDDGAVLRSGDTRIRHPPAELLPASWHDPDKVSCPDRALSVLWLSFCDIVGDIVGLLLLDGVDRHDGKIRVVLVVR